MRAALAAAGLIAGVLNVVVPVAEAASFPTNSSVFFQTSGCQRAPGIGDWYTTQTSASTARYSEFFLEVTDNMAPATVVILDAESTDPGGVEAIDDEILGASDPTRFELRSGDGVILLQGQTVAAGSPNGTTVTFSGIGVGVYRIRSYDGSDQVPGLATGAYCDQAVGDNDDDNGFKIQVNGGSAIDGLLGFLQTTYQQNTGAGLTYQMYFMVGPDSADSNLALRNFDLDDGSTGIVYSRPPDGIGSSVCGAFTCTESVTQGFWNPGDGAPAASLNAGQDDVTANNDLASGAVEIGTWGYRINSWTTTNQTIFEANAGGIRLALTDALPSRAGFFTITPDTTLATTIATPVFHQFDVTNLFFTNDVINFSLSGTNANYSTLLMRDPNCDDNPADAVALTDSDGNGQVDTGLLTSTGTAGATACFFLRVTPNAGASTSDTTRVNGVSLMDSRVGVGDTTRFVTKTTLLPPAISKNFSPNPLASGGTATLTFTLTNVNTVAAALSSTGPNFAFTDVFPITPGAMTLANTTVTNNCGGTLTDNAGATLTVGDVGIRYSGGSIPASSSCTVAVNVTASAIGDHDNTTTSIASTNAGTGNTANATLTVQAMVPPSIAKSFSPSPVGLNTNSTLTLTITNSNPTALTGLDFSDTYPANLVNAPAPGVTNTCGGATTGGAAGGSTIGLTGGTLAANSSCAVTVQVRSGTAGSYLNTAGPVTSTNGGTGNSASASLIVHAPPTVAKSFNPTPVNTSTSSVLTLTLTNPNSTAMTGAAITDTYPAGLVNSPVPSASTTCGGAVTAAAGGNTAALSGGTLPASGSCTITVNTQAAAAGSYVNTVPAGSLTTTNGINQTVATSGTLVVQTIAPPTIAKSFSPATIQTNGLSVLTLVIGNPNATATLIGVAVTDTYPANVFNRTPASPAATCTSGSTGNFTGGADGGTTIGFANGSILAGGNCTVTVNVTHNATGLRTNTTGAVTSTNGGTGGTASAGLTGQAGLVAPTISKNFNLDELGINGVSTLTFTITNPNNATLNNVGFTDTYPAGLVNAATPAVSSNCDNVAGGAAGTTGGVAGGNTIGLAGAPGAGSANDMPANSTCTLTVQVTSTTAGTYNNTSGTVAGCSTNPGGACPGGNTVTGGTASDSITYVRPGITKSFSLDPISSGGTSTLTLVLTNDSDVAFTINNPGFTDTFPVAPGAMTVATPLTVSNTCGSVLRNPGDTANLAAGDTGVRAEGGTIPAHGSCMIGVNVTAAASGTYTNTIAATNLSTSGGTNAAAASDTLTIPNRPTLVKAFSPAIIPVLGVSTLTVTLSNNNPLAATGAAFTDTLPVGLITSGSPSTNCGGTVSNTSNSVTLSGGSIPAGAPGTCTVTINVLNNADTDATIANASGIYANTIAVGALTTSFGSNAAAASANQNVVGGYKSVRVQTDADTSGTPTVGDTLQWSVFYSYPSGGTNISAFQATDTIGANMTLSGTPTASVAGAGCGAAPTITAGYTGTAPNNVLFSGYTLNANCAVRVNFSVTVGAGAAGTTLSNQASGNGTGLSTTVTDNVDTTTTGLPTNVQGSVTAGSVAQTQISTLISPTTVAILQQPTIAKSFAPDPIGSGGTSTLTITLTNPNATTALTGATFTDTFPTSPGAMTVATPLSTSNSCGGTLSENDAIDGDTALEAGDGSVRLTGGTIPASGNCVITINVTAAVSGTYTNTIPAGGLATSGGANSAPASDTLTVSAPMTVVKASTVVSDPFNMTTNPKRIPGAVVEYMVIVSNTTGSLPATSVVMSDAIPANTTYVTGSIVVAGVAQTDATDGDNAEFAAGTVTARIASIAVGATATVTFRVTVN